ncbi:UPF0158 family protein [Clostridium sp.]|uniref:UPF0158 family protein n=1 Tax=Clostridium sp. TaxID=1506 RepID=UPI003216AA6E
MNVLHVDLDLLLELSLTETRGEGECYINITDGEFAYIPQGIIDALNDKSMFDSLEGWEKELARETESIIMNYNDKYLYIPLINEEILIDSMKQFLETLSEDKRFKILEEVDWQNPFLTFNKTLVSYDKLDDFYTFRDNFLCKHLIDWLESNQIKYI